MLRGYIFDGSALVEVLRAVPSRAFVRRLASTPTSDRWTSSTVAGDLLYYARLTNSQGTMTDVVNLLAAIRILPFDLPAAHSYAKVVASLRTGEVAFSASDLTTVALARTHDLVLVSRRAKDFSGLPNLRVEDWFVG